jgi:predicted metal-binding protein
MKTEDKCQGKMCFTVIREKKSVFKGAEGDIEIIGFVSCGGCPGNKAALRAAKMVKRGADTIALTTCITKGNPAGCICPHVQQMQEEIVKKVGKGITVFDHTH